MARSRIVLLAALIAAFAAIAIALPKSGGTSLDVAVARVLERASSDTGSIVFTWISWLGDTALSGLLVAAALFLAFHRRLLAASTIVIATLGAMLINPALKQLFHRGRPEYALEILAGPTWSFPSGHAMASIVGFGIVAFFRRRYERSSHKRIAIIVAACVAVGAVGFSRLYLGVHYLSDVVGGFLAGGVWLIVCIASYEYLSERHKVRATK